MKDLLDLKKALQLFVNRCQNSLGWLILLAISFAPGDAWATKQITEDCRFMGNFRDGPYSYTCQVRIR